MNIDQIAQEAAKQIWHGDWEAAVKANTAIIKVACEKVREGWIEDKHYHKVVTENLELREENDKLRAAQKSEDIIVGQPISVSDLARIIEAGQTKGMKGALQEYQRAAQASEKK